MMLNLADNDISITEFEYQAAFAEQGKSGFWEFSVKLLTGDIIICQIGNRVNYWHIYPDVSGRRHTNRCDVEKLLKTKKRHQWDRTNDQAGH